MSSVVSVERAELSLGTSRILDGVSLGVLAGDRIGVVGRNGGGKSTLIRVLAGLQEVDAGRVARPTGQTVGLLSQSDDLPDEATVRQVVVGQRPDHEWAGDARIRDLLTGLLGGLEASEVGGMDRAVGTLSGGQRRRVALAGLLAADPDLLLLDEPTNHLDIDAVAWLAQYLATKRTRALSALVAITHDRWFLDAVATSTWEVVDGQVGAFEGGYAAYVLAKAERVRMAAVTAERRANLLRKELAWLRRGAPARTTKPRFRLDAAAALISDEPPPRDQVALSRFATTRLGKDVIDLLDVTVRRGERTLLDNVTWRLAPGDRIGVLGANGAGKSTLAQVVVGTLPVNSGRRKVGKTVALAYLSQDVGELDELADRRVIDAVSEVRQYVRLGDKEVSASQLAQQLGFSGPRQQARVGDLSGGERRRLQFVRLLMTEPNVLVLDEPTNDLDIETLTAVEDVLDGWAGTLIVVSHDRYLLERMCDRQVGMLGDGALRDLPGGVEQYFALRAQAAEAAPKPPPPDRSNAATAGEPDAAAVRQARKEMARIERQLSKLTEVEEGLHAKMVTAANDHRAILELNEQLRGVVDEREQLELAWLEAAEIAG